MLRPRYSICHEWLCPLLKGPFLTRPNTSPINPNAGAKCQKCLQAGHWTYDCPNQRTYRPRPTRSALLANPDLRLPEATMVPMDLEKERERAMADLLRTQRGPGEEQEGASEGDDSGTTDYETDSDCTTDTEATAPDEEGEIAAGKDHPREHLDDRGAHSPASSSGFSSSDDSESEAPLKRGRK